jgi:DNA-binding transcriptional regulator YiaG
MKYEDLEAQLNATPGFKETFARMFPDHDLALAVAEVRARRDMTQEEFARLLKVSVAAVRRLESGHLG